MRCLERIEYGALIVGWIFFSTIIAGAHAAKPASDNVRLLSSAPTKSSLWIAGRDFRIRPFTALDSTGRAAGVPSYIVSIKTGTGDWDLPKPNSIPAFQTAIPTDVRDQIALYYSTATGWVIAPRGWELITAAEGADGNSGFDFIASPTPVALKSGELGWMSTWNAPACLGCMLSAADGIIPGAHDLYTKDITQEPSPVPRLVPNPQMMVHPNACTAVFHYSIPNSPPVRAVVYLGYPSDPDNTDIGEEEIYLALPLSESPLADFIIETFRKKVADCGGGPGSSPYN